MQDFWFQNWTKIFFGLKALDSLPAVSRAMGQRALVVYGSERVRQSGLYSRLMESIHTTGVSSVDHGGVRPNPILSHVREGAEKARAEQAEWILAVGGGSVIDEAKAIAAAASTETDVWRFFETGEKPSKALPIAAVPTISGTGSEMNAGTVITNDLTQQKRAIGAPCLLPRFAFLDPSLTATVSRSQTALGVADAFSHVLEPYMNGADACTPVQDRLAEGLMTSIVTISARVLSDLSNYQNRADMMWAAVLAHNGLLGAGRGRVRYEAHAIAHSLSGYMDLPHGATLTAIIPAWLTYSTKRKKEKLLTLAQQVMPRGCANDAVTSQDGVTAMRNWFAEMACPVSLTQLGIGKGDLAAIEKDVTAQCAKAGWTDLGEADVRSILELAM
jgi:alcohol dehydrogenase YqhD (iron-dependent ADH family)